MYMKRLLVILLIDLSVTAYGQSSGTSEVFWRTGTHRSDETQAILSQMQTSNLPVGTLNAISLNQTGAANQAGINTRGAGNQLNINQIGGGNQLNLDLTGSGNAFTLSQLGGNNVLDLKNVQANGQQLDISQRGNNNRLSSDGYPVATGVPIRIEQSGGMQIQITNIR